MNQCKNCQNQFEGSFCNLCGQKIYTDPFQVKEFITSDLKNEIIGFDHGLIYTLKKIVTQPGHSLYNYIKGNRVLFLQPLAYMLTTLGLSELLQSYMDLSIYEKIDKDVPKNIFGKISDFLVNDPKWLLLLLIPLFSYTTSKIFKSAKLNFGDHFLIHCYSISTINFVMTVFLLPLIFIESVSYYKLSASISIGFFVFSYFIFLYQFFRLN